jgi:hypothetical protein
MVLAETQPRDGDDDDTNSQSQREQQQQRTDSNRSTLVSVVNEKTISTSTATKRGSMVLDRQGWKEGGTWEGGTKKKNNNNDFN